MITKSEIQVVLTTEEREVLHNAGRIVKDLITIMVNCKDVTELRCWDTDHDYKSYKFGLLSDILHLMNDIYYSEEVGINNEEEMYSGDKN